MDILNESERRFTKKLCDAMIPVMMEQFWEIWLEAKKESQGKNKVRVFQELLRGVKTWNSSISLKNSEAIIKNQPLFPNLLAAVFVIHVKILSAIRTDKKSKKICIKLPAVDVFTQRWYEACAKDLYESPSIIVDEKSDEERKEVLTVRFCKRIQEVIEELIPTAEILNTYLPLPAAGQDLDLDHDENEEEEDVPDIEDTPPSEDVPESGAMELGETPGGQHMTATTSTSPSVPNVPTTPVPAEAPEEESLFSDAPTKIEKLNHA